MSMSKVLRNYAKSLAPSKEMKRLAREVTDQLHDILHEWASRENYKIYRIVPHGSYAKETAIWCTMDLDIVVVLETRIPQLNDFKKSLENILCKIDKNCENRSHALKFQMNGLEVDLMLAANYVRGPCENVKRTQVENVLRDVKQKQDMNLSEKKEYSTASLSEGAIEFEDNRSEFSRDLSRLAKRWSMSIGIPGFKRGRSSIMEYLGAWAATEEERPPLKADFLTGFRRFLNLVVNPDKLRIFWPDFYGQEDIPHEILSHPPVLLDLTSPYDNLLEGERGYYLKQMSTYAEETLRRLDEAEGRPIVHLEKIFEPNPRIEKIYVGATVKSPRDYLISSIESSQLFPKVEIRAGAKEVDHDIIEKYFFSFIDAVAAAMRMEASDTQTQDDEENITSKVRSELEQFISPGQWLSSNESHKNKDTTFTIPVGKASKKAIRISCNWGM